MRKDVAGEIRFFARKSSNSVSRSAADDRSLALQSALANVEDHEYHKKCHEMSEVDQF